MELTFLGTSSGVPSKERGLTSIALNLSQQRQGIWLFDCGEGTQQQILYSTIKLSQIERIFITHLHGDHLFGLPGLLGTRSMQGITSPVTLYGPTGIKEFTETVLRLSASYMTYPLTIVEVSEGVVCRNTDFTVTAALLRHGVTSFGYRIEESPRPGLLDSERLLQEGVPAGPCWGQLHAGQDVQLEDGRILLSQHYVGTPKPGKIIVIFGDTLPSLSGQELATGADLLVHEATYDAAMVEQAEKRFHSTTVQAAQIASQAGVKRLIITHLSTRYTSDDHSRLLSECQQIFPNTELATDLATFIV